VFALTFPFPILKARAEAKSANVGLETKQSPPPKASKAKLNAMAEPTATTTTEPSVKLEGTATTRPTAKAGSKVKVGPKPRKRRHRAASGSALTRLPEGAPAAMYAALEAGPCHAELERRGISFRVEPNAQGVKIPVRLTGPISGVEFRTDLPDAARETTPWEVYDCRLLLSLADFSHILRRHDVVEIRIFSAWRPPPKHRQLAVERRHPGALAVDVRSMKKASGEELVVLDHFARHRGRPVCTPKWTPSSPKAAELRSIVCGAAEAYIFNCILTPNYNAQHRNHFHLELTAGVTWFMLQ
jgi:hypothetical protein